MEGDSTSIDGNFNSNAAHINIADSVIMGDITQQTIIQNSPEDLAKAMALVLEKLGFVGNSQQSQISSEKTSSIVNVLKASKFMISSGLKIEGTTELKLGNAARLTGRLSTAMEHYERAISTFRSESNRNGEADALINIGLMSLNQGKVDEAYPALRDAQAIKFELGEEKISGTD